METSYNHSYPQKPKIPQTLPVQQATPVKPSKEWSILD